MKSPTNKPKRLNTIEMQRKAQIKAVKGLLSPILSFNLILVDSAVLFFANWIYKTTFKQSEIMSAGIK